MHTYLTQHDAVIGCSYSKEYVKKCADVLDNALASVPAYTPWAAFDPGHCHNPFTRLPLLPFLTKEYMSSQGYERFIPSGKDLSCGLERGEIEIAYTSGSTSDRISNIWYQPWWDASERASWELNAYTHTLQPGNHREAILTSALCAGFACEDGYLSMAQRTRGRFLYLNERSDPTTWAPAHLDRMIGEIGAFEPVVVEANPSFLAHLARYAAHEGKTVRCPNVIVLTYENPTLLHYRQIRSVFNCPIVSSYGSTEAGYVFVECEAGKLHQNTDCCHVDFIPFKPEHGGPHVGCIAVTTFDNPWRALLRFDIGDVVRLSKNRCPCGRTHGLILDSIEGRAKNLTLTTDGRAVTQSTVDRILSTINGINEYQVVQQGRARYELRLVIDTASTISGDATNALRSIYGRSADIHAVRVDAVHPDPPGKYRLTKSTIDYDYHSFLDGRYVPETMDASVSIPIP